MKALKRISINTSFLAISLILFSFTSLFSNPAEPKKLFSSDELMELTLEMDMKAVLKDVGEERDYHMATLKLNEDGSEKEFNVKVKTRGHFRRQRAVCKFPPLKMKFDKSEVENTVFDGQKKIKLVTHCGKNDSYERNILNEYLTYKIYNVLTDKSFRVRLAKIKYIDTKGKYDPIIKYSFFIEDNDDVAARMGGKILNAKNVHPDKTEFDQMTLLSVFQYMVGNTDWSVASLHNIELVSVDPWQPPIAVPFDFDWSGFVNAPYAVPSEKLPIEEVTDRLYRGYYRSIEQLNAVFTVFNDSKDEIMNLVNNFQHMDKKYNEKNAKYIQSFYDIISNPRAVKREFIDNCRQSNLASN